MKLCPDCIRDLMLFFEEHTGTSKCNENGGQFKAVELSTIIKLESLNKYDVNQIEYHIIQLSESNYIITDFSFSINNPADRFQLSKVYYITPKGHEFIANIKQNETWEKILKYLEPLGSVSIKVIEAVAQVAMSTFISNLPL